MLLKSTIYNEMGKSLKNTKLLYKLCDLKSRIYSARRLMNEFPQKRWSVRASLDWLVQKSWRSWYDWQASW